MKVAWTKLIWELVFVAIVAGLVVSHWPEKKEVSQAAKLYVCTAAQFETGECNPCTECAPVPDKEPVIIPVPIDKPKLIRPHPVPKSTVKHISCSQIPMIAYSFSLGTVLEQAKGRGLTQSQLTDVANCWENHHG